MQFRVTISLINSPFAKGTTLFLFISHHSHTFLLFSLCQPWHRSNPEVNQHKTFVGAKVNTLLTITNLSHRGSGWAAALVQESQGRRRHPYCQGCRDQLSYSSKLQPVKPMLLGAKQQYQESPLQAVQRALLSSEPRALQTTRRSRQSHARTLPGIGSCEVKTKGTDPMEPKSFRGNFLVEQDLGPA